MTAITPGALSALISRVYAASRGGDVIEFQRRALECVEHHLRFDCAWWGRGTFSGGEHRVHCSFPYQFPEDIADRLNFGDRNNVVARRVVQAPGQAHYFSRNDLHSQPSTRALTEHMGIAQSICICAVDASTGLTSFISVARRRVAPRFSAHDLTLLELIAPHLSMALDVSLTDQLTTQRNPEKVALLATDAMGSLRVAEPRSIDLLRLEWPAWTGSLLPAPLVARIASHQPEYLGRHLQVSVRWTGDHVFLSMRRREQRDLLTRQERAVACAFASGQSYREVAVHLGLAPATVRHHLRSAYVKLGVSDKAAFATCLNGG